MGNLKETIRAIFGADAKEDEGQHPSAVASLIVPMERFAEAARALKKNMLCWRVLFTAGSIKPVEVTAIRRFREIWGLIVL